VPFCEEDAVELGDTGKFVCPRGDWAGPELACGGGAMVGDGIMGAEVLGVAVATGEDVSATPGLGVCEGAGAGATTLGAMRAYRLKWSIEAVTECSALSTALARLTQLLLDVSQRAI
jgi:hypothetical protein